MKGVERVVEHVLSHREELSKVGRIAVEVYIAYILERIIEHFHAAIGRCFGRLIEKVKEEWEAMAEEVVPGILEKIKKVLAIQLTAAKTLWAKVFEFLHRILQKSDRLKNP